MCDYCTSQMYKVADTPERRIAYRIQKFADECNAHPLNLYRCDSIAKVLNDILVCESGDEGHERETRKDFLEYQREVLTDAEVEDAVMHEQLDRDAR